jgi:hypothetical protein
MIRKSSSKLFTAILAGATVAMSFDVSSYKLILSQNANLTETQLIEQKKPAIAYYSSIGLQTAEPLYLDSIKLKFNLTDKECNLLEKNNFVVSERMSYKNFGSALRGVFNKDMPVFLSTDAVLYTMHMSYDAVLVQVEKSIFEPGIKSVIDAMKTAFPAVASRYTNASMAQNIADVDLYLTVAATLTHGTVASATFASAANVNEILNAINAEKYVSMPLFTTKARELDFSQFTVRGHYVRENLQNYFKAIMWLGRTEFLMTSPKQGDLSLEEKTDLKRMSVDAVLLTEVLKESGMSAKLAEIDSLLSFMVGESDNLTSNELNATMSACGLINAESLISGTSYDKLADSLGKTPEASQKILSQIICIDPANPDSLALPVSYLLMGQRYIVDSYITGNVVYDKIRYNNAPVLRMMPDPLDIMYSLGNDDAAPLLKNELATWHYAPNLQNMRYLIDSYEQNFWHGSLYNTWLNTIRTLNPSQYPSYEKQPLFMRSAAWHQEKLNTQLVSWAQLRHDNLLYAKQSYTPGVSCSFPHGYIEPYPAFYNEIGTFARTASEKFGSVTGGTTVSNFYTRVGQLMDTLEMLSEKELAQDKFTTSDSLFVAGMLFKDGICGSFSTAGWYGNLIFNQALAEDADYTIVDVHTQPYEGDVLVGKVLHAAVGKINLGVFLAQSPSAGNQLMAFIGPVSSYYQTVTDDFKRYTDEEWTGVVDSNRVPLRPDWVNSYLANTTGGEFDIGRVLDGVQYTPSAVHKTSINEKNSAGISVVKNGSILILTLNKSEKIKIGFFDIRGRSITAPVNTQLTAGVHKLVLPAASGYYTAKIICNNAEYKVSVTAVK